MWDILKEIVSTYRNMGNPKPNTIKVFFDVELAMDSTSFPSDRIFDCHLDIVTFWDKELYNCKVIIEYSEWYYF